MCVRACLSVRVCVRTCVPSYMFLPWGKRVGQPAFDLLEEIHTSSGTVKAKQTKLSFNCVLEDYNNVTY